MQLRWDSRDTNFEEAHDVPNVILKAEVNHSVCFVHAEILAPIEDEALLFQHADKSTRGGYHNMQTFVQYMALLTRGDTANAQQGIQPEIFAILC